MRDVIVTLPVDVGDIMLHVEETGGQIKRVRALIQGRWGDVEFAQTDKRPIVEEVEKSFLMIPIGKGGAKGT